MKRFAIGMFLIAALASVAWAQTGRKYFTFEVVNEFGRTTSEQFDVTVYDATSAADVTSTCYTTAEGTTGFTYQNITTGTFGFWYLGDVDIKIASDTTGNAVRVNDLTTTDHVIMLSRNQFVESSSLTVGGLTVSGASTFSNTITVGADGTGYDVLLYGDTTLKNLMWDQNLQTDGVLLFTGTNANFTDDSKLRFGTGASSGAGDLYLSSDSSNVLTLGQAVIGTGTFALGVDGNGIDMTFYGDTASDYMLWDQNAQTNGVLIFEDTGIGLNDDTRIRFGDGATAGAGDLYMASTSGNVLTLGQTVIGTGTFVLGVDGNGIDTTFYGDTASSSMMWDQDGATNGNLVFAACSAAFGDASVLRFGTGTSYAGDLTLSYTGGTNILNLAQVAAGTGTVTIGADGSGIDMTWFSETASDTMTWDQDGATSVGALTLAGSAIMYDQTNVDYTLVAAADALSLTATDHASAALTFGSTGTNGMDVTLQSATAGDLVKFDAGAKTFTLTDVTLNAGVVGTFTRTIVTNTGTDDVTLTAATSGTIYVSNRTTGAEHVYTLPTAAAGLTYTFVDIRTTAGDDLKISAAAGDKINNGTAAAYIVDSGDDTYGVMVTLTAIDATQWIMMEAEPVATSWTAGGP